MLHAFIADGRLFIRQNDGSLLEITSKFAAEKAHAAQRQKDLHSWKTASENQNQSFFSPQVVWAKQASLHTSKQFIFTHVMIKDPNTLYYLITNNSVTGLFKYQMDQDYEQRLFHKNDFVSFGIDYCQKTDRFVTALLKDDASVDLELLDSDGQYIETVTSGDSKDSNPSFSAQDPDEILYQSAGIARNDAGFVFAHGPESINKINIKTGQITELLSDDRNDFLLPRQDAQGNLYCIRRPYQRFGYQSPLRIIWDIITFPVRFVIAIVSFLNVFTKLFDGRPPQALGPGVGPPATEKHVRVLGQTIQLAKIQRDARYTREPSLVPGSWQLVRFNEKGQKQVIANKVSYFDIDPDGSIHYTNGFRVRRFSDNNADTLFKYRIIENLKIAPTEPQT